MEPLELITLAREAREHAYAPYSSFCVGAALLAASGKVYQGCNVENAAYSPSCCAERIAFYRAVCSGERSFTSIAIVGGKQGQEPTDCPPCGVCRQVMKEFCSDDFLVFMGGADDQFRAMTLGQLLPAAFGLPNEEE